MLAILATHPIQYQVPIWRGLASRGDVPLRVFYLSDHGQRPSFDPGFGRDIAWDLDLSSGYPHEFLPARRRQRQEGFFWLRLPPGFGELLRQQGVTVLWVQGWQVAAYWQAIFAARRAGIEVWIRGDTNLRSGATGWRQRLKRRLLRFLLRRVDRFLAVGKANRDFYRSLGIAESRISEALHCVENGRFEQSARELEPRRSELRAGWKIADEAFCFLFAGKFVAKKRPLEFAEAFRRLLARRPDLRLHALFVGSGELSQAVEASMAGLPASFAGFLNQTAMPRAYVAADALVLPSDGTETWGLVVNEAMASGLACIVSDACGCVEDLVLPFQPSLSFPLGDIDALSAAMEALANTPIPPEMPRLHVARYDVDRTVDSVAAAYLSRS